MDGRLALISAWMNSSEIYFVITVVLVCSGEWYLPWCHGTSTSSVPFRPPFGPQSDPFGPHWNPFGPYSDPFGFPLGPHSSPFGPHWNLFASPCRPLSNPFGFHSEPIQTRSDPTWANNHSDSTPTPLRTHSEPIRTPFGTHPIPLRLQKMSPNIQCFIPKHQIYIPHTPLGNTTY